MKFRFHNVPRHGGSKPGDVVGAWTCVRATNDQPSESSPDWRPSVVRDSAWDEPGPPGPPGTDGTNGANGQDGRAGDDGRGWTYTGEWSSSRQYNEGDVATADGSSFVCLKDHKDREPPNRRFWGVVATAGRDGVDGRDGFGKGVKGDRGDTVDTSATADSQMTIGDVIYASGNGHVDLAVASPAVGDERAKAFAFGIVTSVKGSTVKYRTTGVVENPNWSLTPQEVYYLSPTVPGGMTSTYPSESGQFVVILGVATSPTQLALNIHWMLEQA